MTIVRRAEARLGRKRKRSSKRVRSAIGLAWLTLLFALAGPLASGAEAAPAWLSPLDVSMSGADGSEPQVATDAIGDATVVWERFDGVQQTVQSASRPAGGSWQAPVTLSVDAPTEDSFLPQVAMDPAGDAMAVWAHFTTGPGEVVQAAARPAGGAWEAPLTISPEGNEVPHPEVALDARGDALAVWELHTAPANRIEASFRPTGGAWQAPVELSDPTHDANIGGISVDPAGDAAVSFVQETGSTEVVEVASRPAGEAWQKPLEVSGGEASLPSVALDARGDARAIWTVKAGANWIVQSAYQPSGGRLAGAAGALSGQRCPAAGAHRRRRSRRRGCRLACLRRQKHARRSGARRARRFLAASREALRARPGCRRTEGGDRPSRQRFRHLGTNERRR